jgi:hypothetical protein
MILVCVLACISVVFTLHVWLHITNPYASLSIVKQPYTTDVLPSGDIAVRKQFNLQAYDSPLGRAVGYYKGGFLILQNTYFGSRPAPSNRAGDIIQDIHKLRFDSSKPYLISGDQFSVLYPRNLGVFYNSLLDPHTAHDQTDWQNRQRIYLQSALYALDAFAAANSLTTTIVPIGSETAVLTEVHPGSVPSDSLYGLLYALNALQDTSHDSQSAYRLQTATVTRQILTLRRYDLARLLNIYLQQVYDPATGLVRAHCDFAGARDGVVRDRSFYDTVILWKTLSLAKQLHIPMPAVDTGALRNKILAAYWDDAEGHFKDDLSSHPAGTNYASDWLITLPTGLLNPANPADQTYLTRSVEFIRQKGIAAPFPIKYQATNSQVDAPWAVRMFVPNYGGDAIWSYWGAQYITLLAQLSSVTGDASYRQEAQRDIAIYNQKIEQYHGFPETFDARGNFLQNAIYKSIRQTGWVVQFEQAKMLLNN